VVGDDLPLALILDEDLQQARAETPFSIRRQAGREFLETRDRGQDVDHGDVGTQEFQRHDVVMERRSTIWTLKKELVMFQEHFVSGGELPQNVGEGAVISEMERVSSRIPAGPGRGLLLDDVANCGLIVYGLRTSGGGAQSDSDEQQKFHHLDDPTESVARRSGENGSNSHGLKLSRTGAEVLRES
jgi:hypothetical protein